MRHIKILLALAQSSGAQFWHEQVQPDFTHSDQTGIVPVVLQRGIKPVQVVVLRRFRIQRVNAQRITVAAHMGQRAHRLEVGYLNRRQDTMDYLIARGISSHRRTGQAEFRGIQMAVGVDELHAPKSQGGQAD